MSTLNELKAKHKEQLRMLQSEQQQVVAEFTASLKDAQDDLKEAQLTEIRVTVLATLEAQNWAMVATCSALGIHPPTFYNLIGRCGLLEEYKKNNSGSGRSSSNPHARVGPKPNRKPRKY